MTGSFWQFATDAQQATDSGLARVRRLRDDLDLRLQGLRASQVDYFEQSAKALRDNVDGWLRQLSPPQPQPPRQDTTGWPGLDPTMGGDAGYFPPGAAETTRALGQTTLPAPDVAPAPPAMPEADVSLGAGEPGASAALGQLAQTATRHTPGASIVEATVREASPGPMTADTPLQNTLGIAQLASGYVPISRAPARAVAPGGWMPTQAAARGIMEAIPGGATPVIPGVDPDTPFLGGLTTPDVVIPAAVGILAGNPMEAAQLGRSALGGLEDLGRAAPGSRLGAALGGQAQDAVPAFYRGTGTDLFDSYPAVGELVDGRVVREGVPNTSSISATFDDWDELPGIREVPMDAFDQAGPPGSSFYSADDIRHARALSDAIGESGEISPLIVAIDDQGPYILEGLHRFEALRFLGAKSFPALVVVEESARPVAGAGIASGTGGTATDFGSLLRAAAGNPTRAEAAGGQVGMLLGTGAGASQVEEDDDPRTVAGKLLTGAAAGGLAGANTARAVRQIGDLSRSLGILPEAADEAARLRAGLDQRYQAYERAQQRLQELDAEIAARSATGTGAIERPKWARGLTQADLEEIARRAEVNPYEPLWHEQIDPEAVRLYRAEVVKGRTAETAGETPGQARATLAALRKEQRDVSRQLKQFERETMQDLERESLLRERAERDPFAWEQAPEKPADVDLPDWDAIKAEAAARFPAVPEPVRPVVWRAAQDLAPPPAAVGEVPGVAAAPAPELLQQAQTGLGMPVERWVQTKQGALFGPEEATALGVALTRAGDDLGALVAENAAARAAGNLSLDGEAALADKALEFATLAATKAGRGDEAARTLQAFRAAMGSVPGATAPRGIPRDQVVEAAFKAIGTDRAKFQQWVTKYQTLTDPQEQHRYLQALYKPDLWDHLETLRYASMLSSWKTHEANFLSNLLESGARPAQLLAAGYGKEAGEYVRGMAMALPDAVSAAKAAFSGNLPPSATKLEHIQTGRAFGGSPLGRAVRAPIDALVAADEFWKALTRQGYLRAEAYRLAGDGPGRSERMLDILDNPSKELLAAAEAQAQRATYQDDVPEWLQRFSLLRSAKSFTDKTSQALAFVAHLAVPFLRTPWNVAKRAATDLAYPVVGQVEYQRAMRAGDTRAARLIRARQTLTFGISVALGGLAATGHLTGSGPKNPDTRRALEATGWQPNSLVVPGPDGRPRYFGLNSFGPVGLEAMAIANLFEAFQDSDLASNDLGEHAVEVYRRLSRLAADATFLTSVGGFLDVATGASVHGQDPGQSLGRWAGTAATSLLPYGGALAAAERVASPVLREQDTPWEAFAGRIPGLAGTVPVKTGFAGQPRRSGTENLVLNILSPVRTSEGRTGAMADAAREVYDLRRQREGTRRFVGSESASMDREIARAVARVQDWRRNPRGAPKPTAEELELYQRFGGRPNLVYERLGQQAARRESQAGPLPVGAGQAPTVTLADIFG